MKEKKAKMEIENLAVMIQRGFAEVHDKISEIDHKMVTIDNKMATKEDLSKLETRLVDRIEQLDLRISSNASIWDKNFDDINDSVLELSKRMNRVEDRLVKVK